MIAGASTDYNATPEEAAELYQQLADQLDIEQDLRSMTVSLDGENGFDLVLTLGEEDGKPVIQSFSSADSLGLSWSLDANADSLNIEERIADVVEMELTGAYHEEMEATYGLTEEEQESRAAREEHLDEMQKIVDEMHKERE